MKDSEFLKLINTRIQSPGLKLIVLNLQRLLLTTNSPKMGLFYCKIVFEEQIHPHCILYLNMLYKTLLVLDPTNEELEYETTNE